MKSALTQMIAPAESHVVSPVGVVGDLWRQQLALGAQVLSSVFLGFQVMRTVEGQSALDVWQTPFLATLD